MLSGTGESEEMSMSEMTKDVCGWGPLIWPCGLHTAQGHTGSKKRIHHGTMNRSMMNRGTTYDEAIMAM